MQKASKFLLLYAVLYFLFLYAPIFLLPIFAFNDSAIISFPLSGVTLDWFFLLWETEALHDALYNSVMIAIIAATLSTALGIFAARAATRYDFPGKKGITGFLLLPIVLPEIIVGVALLGHVVGELVHSGRRGRACRAHRFISHRINGAHVVDKFACQVDW